MVYTWNWKLNCCEKVVVGVKRHDVTCVNKILHSDAFNLNWVIVIMNRIFICSFICIGFLMCSVPYIIISFGNVSYFIFLFSFTVSVRSVHDGWTKNRCYTMHADEFIKNEGMRLVMHMFSLWSSGLCSVSFVLP